ncbi:MAG: hypothetical protein JNM10_01610 [Planctomycetia bacterium]|nr:hypothetical protein [Planctomycetia bacterium]
MASRIPLAATHVADLTEAWAHDLRAAPTTERIAVLAEADALRRAPRDPDDSWRVIAAYRALVDRALEGPEGPARAVFMAEEDPARDGLTRRFAEVARGAPGDDGIRGACAWAACAADDRDLRAALARLLELHHATDDRADAVAFAVLHALAGVFLRQHREFEALIVARRAADVARRAPDLSPVDRAHAAALLARVFVGLGDAARLRAHLPAMLAAADAMDEPDATRARAHAHLLLSRAAVDDGDLETAATALADAEAILRRDLGTPGFGPAIVRSTALRLAVARRDVPALERCLAEQPAPRGDDQGWLVGLVALATARGDADAAIAHARRALDALGGARLAPSTRLARAVAVARAVGDGERTADLATEAWHLAADAALARLNELDRSVREVGALGPLAADDLDALAAHRARFVASHREVLEPLRLRLEAATRHGTLPPWATPPRGDLLLVCAWCLSVRDRDGTWLPVGHLVYGAQSLPMTHGACPRCLDELAASVRRDVGDPTGFSAG